MVLDITLKDETYFLKINKKLFQNTSVKLELLQAENDLTKKYLPYGVFKLKGKTFGLGGCFKYMSFDANYQYYECAFAKPTDRIARRRMMLTLYLLTYYIVETMYYHKEFFGDNVWDDQSLSFVIFDGEQGSHDIGGQLYPWFKQKLATLDKGQLKKLENHVQSELNRMHNYLHNKDISYEQITITNDTFFILVNTGGRWINWKAGWSLDQTDDFNSHNINYSFDQDLCFTGIVVMNTWLREN